VSSMPQQPQPCPVDAEQVVLGVDTHKDNHVAAVLTVVGVVLGTKAFPATAAGYRALLKWARGFGVLHRAGVEGTGSYGMALTRVLRGEGVLVVEVNRPDKTTRRRRGKNDAIDAECAARAVLSGRAESSAKAGTGTVETVRLFKLAKSSAVKSRTQAINQLKSVLICADPQLRESLSGLGITELVRRCAHLQLDAGTDTDTDPARYTLRLLAERIQYLTEQVDELTKQIGDAIAAHAPQLLEHNGVGPDTAADLLITAGGNPDRLRSEASFAALCGASPVEASSGKTERHRLNRGGDRQANAALYRIALCRLRWDQRTRNYAQRRVAEGKTRREVLRCLKRYIAREIYPLIVKCQTDPKAPSSA
jgi:transposase